MVERLVIGAIIGAVIALSGSRYFKRLPEARRKQTVIAISAGSWAVIALSFAALGIVIDWANGNRADVIWITVALSIFLVCAVISVRSFLRLKKMAT